MFKCIKDADVAKLVDALDLGSSEQPSWEFESLRPQANKFYSYKVL